MNPRSSSKKGARRAWRHCRRRHGSRDRREGAPRRRHREELGAEFVRLAAKPRKRPWRADGLILLNEVDPRIGRRHATTIARRDALDIIEAKFEAGAPARSNSILATMRKMFAWAVDRGHLETSPALGGKPRGKLVRRDRVQSSAELKAIWRALPEAGAVEVGERVMVRRDSGFTRWAWAHRFCAWRDPGRADFSDEMF